VTKLINQLDISFWIASSSLYGAETWTLRSEEQKHLESFEMWCWRRMERISWTDHVRNEEVLLRVKEQRNIPHEIRKRKANWIGHILHRNCLLQRVTEGKMQGGIEVTGRQGKKRRKLLDDLNPLNRELNPICYFLASLAHHFLHVSRIMVKSLLLRLLMSYIYIYIYIYIYGVHIFYVSR